MSQTPRAQWAEAAQQALDRAGRSRGGARNAIIEILARQDCALTALEIETKAGSAARPASRASIYRVLEELETYGLVQRVEVGQSKALYEPIDPSGEHHHHLVCDQCGRLIPFDDRALERAIGGVSRRLSFDVNAHEVTLHGRCERCRR